MAQGETLCFLAQSSMVMLIFPMGCFPWWESVKKLDRCGSRWVLLELRNWGWAPGLESCVQHLCTESGTFMRNGQKSTLKAGGWGVSPSLWEQRQWASCLDTDVCLLPVEGGRPGPCGPPLPKARARGHPGRFWKRMIFLRVLSPQDSCPGSARSTPCGRSHVPYTGTWVRWTRLL